MPPETSPSTQPAEVTPASDERSEVFDVRTVKRHLDNAKATLTGLGNLLGKPENGLQATELATDLYDLVTEVEGSIDSQQFLLANEADQRVVLQDLMVSFTTIGERLTSVVDESNGEMISEDVRNNVKNAGKRLSFYAGKLEKITSAPAKAGELVNPSFFEQAEAGEVDTEDVAEAPTEAVEETAAQAAEALQAAAGEAADPVVAATVAEGVSAIEDAAEAGTEPVEGGTEPLPEAAAEQRETVYWVIAGTEAARGREGNNPNQDTILRDDKNRLYGVFDGAGGHSKADWASQEASRVVRTTLESDADFTSADPRKVAAAIEQAMRAANKAVYEGGNGGAYTTGTIAKIVETPEGRKVVLGATGDSFAYRRNPDGRLEKVHSEDGSLASTYLNLLALKAAWNEGKYENREHLLQHALRTLDSNNLGKVVIGPVVDFVLQSSPSEIKRATGKEVAQFLDEVEGRDELKAAGPIAEFLFKTRNVLGEALGDPVDRYTPRVSIIDLPPGYGFLLTGDGITDPLSTGQIEEILSNSPGSLIEAAHQARGLRGKDDDASYVFINPIEEVDGEPTIPQNTVVYNAGPSPRQVEFTAVPAYIPPQEDTQPLEPLEGGTEPLQIYPVQYRSDGTEILRPPVETGDDESTAEPSVDRDKAYDNLRHQLNRAAAMADIEFNGIAPDSDQAKQILRQVDTANVDLLEQNQNIRSMFDAALSQVMHPDISQNLLNSTLEQLKDGDLYEELEIEAIAEATGLPENTVVKLLQKQVDQTMHGIRNREMAERSGWKAVGKRVALAGAGIAAAFSGVGTGLVAGGMIAGQYFFNRRESNVAAARETELLNEFNQEVATDTGTAKADMMTVFMQSVAEAKQAQLDKGVVGAMIGPAEVDNDIMLYDQINLKHYVEQVLEVEGDDVTPESLTNTVQAIIALKMLDLQNAQVEAELGVSDELEAPSRFKKFVERVLPAQYAEADAVTKALGKSALFAGVAVAARAADIPGVREAFGALAGANLAGAAVDWALQKRNNQDVASLRGSLEQLRAAAEQDGAITDSVKHQMITAKEVLQQAEFVRNNPVLAAQLQREVNRLESILLTGAANALEQVTKLNDDYAKKLTDEQNEIQNDRISRAAARVAGAVIGASAASLLGSSTVESLGTLENLKKMFSIDTSGIGNLLGQAMESAGDSTSDSRAPSVQGARPEIPTAGSGAPTAPAGEVPVTTASGAASPVEPVQPGGTPAAPGAEIPVSSVANSEIGTVEVPTGPASGEYTIDDATKAVTLPDGREFNADQWSRSVVGDKEGISHAIQRILLAEPDRFGIDKTSLDSFNDKMMEIMKNTSFNVDGVSSAVYDSASDEQLWVMEGDRYSVDLQVQADGSVKMDLIDRTTGQSIVDDPAALNQALDVKGTSGATAEAAAVVAEASNSSTPTVEAVPTYTAGQEAVINQYPWYTPGNAESSVEALLAAQGNYFGGGSAATSAAEGQAIQQAMAQVQAVEQQFHAAGSGGVTSAEQAVAAAALTSEVLDNNQRAENLVKRAVNRNMPFDRFARQMNRLIANGSGKLPEVNGIRFQTVPGTSEIRMVNFDGNMTMLTGESYAAFQSESQSAGNVDFNSLIAANAEAATPETPAAAQPEPVQPEAVAEAADIAPLEVPSKFTVGPTDMVVSPEAKQLMAEWGVDARALREGKLEVGSATVTLSSTPEGVAAQPTENKIVRLSVQSGELVIGFEEYGGGTGEIKGDWVAILQQAGASA